MPDVTYDWSEISCTTQAIDRPTDRTQFNKSMSLTLSTSTALPSEILSNLDEKICFTALEYVMTLLASQSLLALKDINLSNREKQLIKRELTTELHVFHDWVKKTLRTDITKGSLHRKKYGAKTFTANTHSDQKGSIKKTLAEKAQECMRTELIRKQHLAVQVNLSPVAKSINPSSGTELSSRITSTPMAYPGVGTTIVEPTFTGLSMVQIVEEDYVHFLSNFFNLICQSE